MWNLISFQFSLRKTIFFGVLISSSSAFAQDNIETNQNQVQIIQESLPIPTELKQNPEEFYVINDKPVTKQEYLDYLAKKEEEEKNSPEQ